VVEDGPPRLGSIGNVGTRMSLDWRVVAAEFRVERDVVVGVDV
jgi:hypothetical protein